MSRYGLPAAAIVVAFLGGAAGGLLGVCGPFTDISDAAFCPFVLEIFTLGITTGTTPTTYDPASTVSRLQMAAFLSRTVDRTLQRGSPRSSMGRFWTPQSAQSLGVTSLGNFPILAESDGADIWVSVGTANTVARVRASDGKLLETWTGATSPKGVMVALGQIFVTGHSVPGRLFRIEPTQLAGAVTTVATNLGDNANGIVFDGSLIWTANGNGTVSRVTPGTSTPWTVTTTAGFQRLEGILYDGANVWVADFLGGTLSKLDGSAAVLQTVTVGIGAFYPVFDGTNIWVPGGASVAVIRASSGAVLATLTGNGLDSPYQASFDGQRVLVTNLSGQSVSLWKAADLTAIGSFNAGGIAQGSCSDGINFWVAINNAGLLVKF